MTPHAVPRLWPQATVVVAGTGPSLTAADLAYCRDRARVIVVNNAWTLAPWADVLYAADDKFWRWQNGVPQFQGLKYTIDPCRKVWPGLQVVKNTGHTGLERASTGVRTGYNSGYQAINLAVHFGASRIVLLGFDMHGSHFFGSHPDGSRPPFAMCLQAFTTLVEPLREAGVEILNCTPGSKITAFPSARLEDVFAEALEVAV